MNKSELISSMAEKLKLTKKDTETILNAFIESIEETLKKKEKVQLIGFGTFEPRNRAARIDRNPRTKEESLCSRAAFLLFYFLLLIMFITNECTILSIDKNDLLYKI